MFFREVLRPLDQAVADFFGGVSRVGAGDPVLGPLPADTQPPKDQANGFGVQDSMRRIPLAVLLRQLHPDDDEGLTALVENLREPNVPTRRMAAEALGQLGPSARGAAASLRQALHDPSISVRVRAVVALWRVSGETRTTLEVLRTVLRDAVSPGERGEAALGQMGFAARDALLALRQASEDSNPFVRRTPARPCKRSMSRVDGRDRWRSPA